MSPSSGCHGNQRESPSREPPRKNPAAPPPPLPPKGCSQGQRPPPRPGRVLPCLETPIVPGGQPQSQARVARGHHGRSHPETAVPITLPPPGPRQLLGTPVPESSGGGGVFALGCCAPWGPRDLGVPPANSPGAEGSPPPASGHRAPRLREKGLGKVPRGHLGPKPLQGLPQPTPPPLAAPQNAGPAALAPDASRLRRAGFAAGYGMSQNSPPRPPLSPPACPAPTQSRSGRPAAVPTVPVPLASPGVVTPSTVPSAMPGAG